MDIDNRKRKREYRDVLGVDENADEETIKKAYHRLALEYHPDRPSNKQRKEDSDRMFHKVKEAYDSLTASANSMSLLKNTFKCAKTSNAVEAFLNSSGKLGTFSPMKAEEFSGNNGSRSDLGGGSQHNLSTQFNLGSMSSSILNQLGPKFASVINNPASPLLRETRSPARKGQSLQTALKVTFKESVSGCNKTIEFSRSLTCTQCSGAGTSISRFSSSNSPSVGGSPPLGSCRDCNGRGVLFAKISAASVSTTCTTCNGTGSHDSGKLSMGSMVGSGASTKGLGCTLCGGAGKMSSRKTCTVAVPAGVVTDSQKIFEGEGDDGTDGGPPGDLIICFKVEAHPFYQRRSDDVCCKINVSIPQLILGGRIDVYAIYGEKIIVEVPPVSIQAINQGERPKHQIVKVANQGFPSSRAVSEGECKNGNMYIQISGEMPTTISEEEKVLLQRLSSMRNFAHQEVFGDPAR